MASEIMISTKTIQEYVKDLTKTGQIKDVIERSRDQYGMQSFDQHLTDLYKAGRITLEVARMAASNPSDFERALQFGDTSAPDEPPGDLATPLFVEENEPGADASAGLPAGSDDDDVLELA